MERAHSQGLNMLDELLEKTIPVTLANIEREYPNQIAHVLHGPATNLSPRGLFPIFYGCYDWHSAVHAHWQLIRVRRLFPNLSHSQQIDSLLERQLTAEKAAGEVAYLSAPGRLGFERPYGLAWLLQLTAECRQWGTTTSQQWLDNLTALEQLAADRFRPWLPKLSYPIRSGYHNQTAFALGLVYDWAETADDTELVDLIAYHGRRFYQADTNTPLNYEPSGHDFLSPSLGEADLMRRLLPPAEFGAWLNDFLPLIPHDGTTNWLQPEVVSDPTDGRIAHLAGLNLSRAWMLEGITSGLPIDDRRRPALENTAAKHAAAGLKYLDEDNYMLTHWLFSFAVYLLTKRGISD